LPVKTHSFGFRRCVSTTSD